LWHQKRHDFDDDFREGFAKWVVTDEGRVSALRKAGFTEQEIADLAEGVIPERYNVHHIDPLDAEGENVYENVMFVLKDPFHRVLRNDKKKANRGLVPGQRQEGFPWRDLKEFVSPPKQPDEFRPKIEESGLIKAQRPTSPYRRNPRAGE